MSKIILVTGGARSGKSTFAEKKVREFGENINYIATAIAFDDGMRDRIKKHIAQRPSSWHTIEIYKDFGNLLNDPKFISCDGIIFDCLTVMISNIMFDEEMDYDSISMDRVNEIEKIVDREVEGLLNIIEVNNKKIVFVTNELGMGLVAPYKLGNYFRDIAGRINQKIASRADEVYFTVCGIPTQIK